MEQYGAADLPVAIQQIADLGAVWVRQRFDWAAIERNPDAYDWSVWDGIVSAATQQGLRIIAVLDTAPAWAGTPPEPAVFARFAAAVASRYGAVLSYYQIWHNPNLGDNWGGRADSYGYTELLAAAATAIRTADPDARILLGSLAPTVEVGERNFAEDVFLQMLDAAGAGPYFDIVAVQPYGFSAGPEDRRVDRSVLNFSRAILVREKLDALGYDDVAIWASHFGWNSVPDGWDGPASIWGKVDEAQQAAYTAVALERAEREWPWMGVMCLNSYQPRMADPEAAILNAEEHWGFALTTPDGKLRPVSSVFQAWAKRPRSALPGSYPAGTSFARFEGKWTIGSQGADIGETGDSVELTFEGTGVALTVRRGPYRAFLFVTVDGAASPSLPLDREGRSYVVLYDPLAAVATVPLAEGLSPGTHTVRVVAERGWAQWALVDWRVVSEPERGAMSWVLGIAGLVGVLALVWAVDAAGRLEWRAPLRRGGEAWLRLSGGVRAAVGVFLGGVYLFGAWQAIAAGSLLRRLGDQGELAAVFAAATLYYVSPWAVVTAVAGILVSLVVLAEPALGLALTMAAAPLYLHPLSLLGKSFSLAELLLLPTLVGWFVAVLADPRRLAELLRKDRWLWALCGAFVGVAILSALGAEHLREAFRELRLAIVEPVLYALALATLPMQPRDRRRIVDAWVLSAVGVAVIGLIQYFVLGDVITAEGGVRRLRSLYGSPNNVGLYLGRVLPVLMAGVIWQGSESSGVRAYVRNLLLSPRRLLYLAGLVPVSLALMLSLSRGAIVLGIPAALLTMGMLAGKRWRRATLVVLVLGIAAVIPLLRTPRFAGLLDLQSGTTSFRLSLWHSAWGMIRDHPFLGVGPDNFLYAYRTRYVLPTAWEEFNLSHPHNVVMDFASRLGLAGLAVFGALQIWYWRRSVPLALRGRSTGRWLALGLAGSMADFLAHGLVDASYFVIDLAFTFFLSYAIVLWLRDELV